MRNSLTQERLLEVLHYEPETGVFIWRIDKRVKCAGKIAGGINENHGYRLIGIDGTRYLAHRLAWLYVTGSWPAHFLDHKDMDRTNNRFENLREVTNKQNMENKFSQKNTASGFMGVSWYKDGNKWQVGIKHNGKRIHIGHFDDFDEACAARLAAERKYFTHSPRVQP